MKPYIPPQLLRDGVELTIHAIETYESWIIRDTAGEPLRKPTLSYAFQMAEQRQKSALSEQWIDLVLNFRRDDTVEDDVWTANLFNPYNAEDVIRKLRELLLPGGYLSVPLARPSAEDTSPPPGSAG